MEYEDTNILRTQYVDDLVAQRQALEDALVYQNIEVTTGEGLKTLVPKVASITGSKPYIPFISFYAPAMNVSQLTNDELKNILDTINFNKQSSFAYFLGNQSKIIEVDFSKIFIKPNTPVHHMFYYCNYLKTIKFSSYNDLTGISDLSYMTYSSPSRLVDVDYSSFRLDENLLLNINYAFSSAIKLPMNFFDCTYDITKSDLIRDVNFTETYKVFDTRKIKFKVPEGVTSLTLYNTYSGKFDEFIFDFALDNVENLPDNGYGISYTFNVTCNKLTLLNKEKAKIKSIYSGFQFNGIKTLDLSNLNLSNCTSLNRFLSDVKASTVYLYNVDTSKSTTFTQWFSSTTHPVEYVYSDQLDASSATNIGSQFTISGCRLKHFMGFKNLGKAYKQKTANYTYYGLYMNGANYLSHESAISIINGLYDLNLTYDVANGGTLYTQKVYFASRVLSSLTPEEIAIATNKGWTVS